MIKNLLKKTATVLFNLKKLNTKQNFAKTSLKMGFAVMVKSVDLPTDFIS